MKLSTAGGRGQGSHQRAGGGVAVSRTLECGLSTLFLSGGELGKVPWALAPGRLSQLALVTLSKFGYGERSLSVCQSVIQSIANPGKSKGRGDAREKQNEEEQGRPDLGLPGLPPVTLGYH